MVKVKNIRGLEKYLFNIIVKLNVFCYFIPEVKKISIKRFIAFLRRLLYFFSKLRENKFVKIGKYTRPDLYVPGFPSTAFYTACRKLMIFDVPLPAITVLVSLTSACRFNCLLASSKCNGRRENHKGCKHLGKIIVSDN